MERDTSEQAGQPGRLREQGRGGEGCRPSREDSICIDWVVLTIGNKVFCSLGMLQEKRMEIDKHSLNIGDYNRTVGKGPGSRPQVSKESSMERSPYFDKVSVSLLTLTNQLVKLVAIIFTPMF